MYQITLEGFGLWALTSLDLESDPEARTIACQPQSNFWVTAVSVHTNFLFIFPNLSTTYTKKLRLAPTP